MRRRIALALATTTFLTGDAVAQATRPDPRLAKLRAEALAAVDARAGEVQRIIDQVFSFGELGMQEVETSKYLTGILEQNGFTIERGVGGMPTAWVARWGSGKPVIALGSDIDGIPRATRSPAWPIATPSSAAPLATAKATTAVRR